LHFSEKDVYYAFFELKLARLFITSPQEDINVINSPEATNSTKPTQYSEFSVFDQVNGSCSKNLKQPVRSLTRHNRKYISVSDYPVNTTR
jgi:thiamine pyrophosphokinase